jgi:hypothetical protein
MPQLNKIASSIVHVVQLTNRHRLKIRKGGATDTNNRMGFLVLSDPAILVTRAVKGLWVMVEWTQVCKKTVD